MKFILLGFLIFILYRMIAKPKKLDLPNQKGPLQEPEKEDFVDYEELE